MLEFIWRCGFFESQKGCLELFCGIFEATVETVLVQLELTDLECNGSLKTKKDSAWSTQFIRSILETMPQLFLHVARALCMFGSTYLHI